MRRIYQGRIGARREGVAGGSRGGREAEEGWRRRGQSKSSGRARSGVVPGPSTIGPVAGVPVRTQKFHVDPQCETRMLDFGQFDFGQFDFGSWPKSNWPKSKLAEVEINWPKSNRWCLLCFFFLSFFFFLLLCFYFSLLFSCSYRSLSSFCFCAVSVFVSKKPELNPKPRTLHPPMDPSAGPPTTGEPPSARTTLRSTTLHRTTLRRTTLPPDRPKFRSFFSLLPPQFSFFFLSLGVLSCNFVGVFEGRNSEMCTFGLSGCRVKPRRPHRTRQPENSKRAPFPICPFHHSDFALHVLIWKTQLCTDASL